MHLGTKALLDFFDRHRQDTALVLVTITATEGSTYRKPGAMMLISEDGQYEGMISGGCLEGDLLQHAANVFDSGKPASVTYDMHADEQLVWGLGLGCDGIIHLLLQRLDSDSGFALLELLESSQNARAGMITGLVTGSDSMQLPVGSIAALTLDARFGPQALLEILSESLEPGVPNWRFRNRNAPGFQFMMIHMPPCPRILLCGAGPDAEPVARQITALDWECYLIDHRPAYAREDRFPPGCTVTLCRPENLAEAVDLEQIDAAVIMSHHLENDAAYLRQIAVAPPPYVGVLGPAARRDRLQEMAGCPDCQVFGPVGLDIGAEMPEAIALSVVSEIHAVLNRRDGHSLTGRAPTPRPGPQSHGTND